LLGLATAKVHKALCVCSFGLFSLIVLVYFVAIVVALLTVVLIPNETLVNFCNGQMGSSTPKWVLNILDKALVRI
jgi:hypothetical protein